MLEAGIKPMYVTIDIECFMLFPLLRHSIPLDVDLCSKENLQL